MPGLIVRALISLQERLALRRNDCFLDQIADDLVNAAVQAVIACVHVELRLFGCLIGAGDSCEFFDFPCPCFGIEPFGVALFANAEIGCAVNLDEVSCVHKGSCLIAVSSEWGYKCSQNDHACIEEQLGYLPNATNVLLSVGIGKAQVLAEAVANVVAVQHVSGKSAFKQSSIDGIGQGAFASSA